MSSKTENGSLPLTKVVLYKHGIGYFERRGKVTGLSSVELLCAADEIDDMLKSLLVLTGKGGRIDGVTYESSKTLEQRLAQFGFDMRGCSGLDDLLMQIKGLPVTVVTSGKSTTGRVIGLDSTEQVVNESVSHEKQLIIYTADASFKRIALSAISSIKLEDQTMASEINQQLELLFQNARRKDKKTLKIAFPTLKSKDILIAYSIPCPIWKTSYRLVFGDGNQPLIQGMAIVDNTQEEDWSDVEMALVSAAPISFIQPLYDPIVPQRRVIAPQGVTSSGPVMAERAQRLETARFTNAPLPAGAAVPPGMARAAMFDTAQIGAEQAWGASGAAGGAASLPAGTIGRLAALTEMQSLDVSGESAGELFEYKIQAPVTVPRNSSALIPIVQQIVEGERISLYNEEKNAKFPHCTVKLTNTTGLTLEAGPVTIMERDAYAGEALLDVLKPDDTRFLPYALDNGCSVIVRVSQENKPIWRVRNAHGIIFMDYRMRSSKTYELENLTAQPKTVYVEHRISQGAELVSEQKPKETTQNYYRFEIELEPKQSSSLKVWEEQEISRQLYLVNAVAIDIKQFDWLLRQNFVNKEFLAYLKQVIQLRQQLVQLMTQKGRLEAQMQQYTADQARARENLKTLGSTNERYRQALDQAEDAINNTKAQLDTLENDLQSVNLQFAQFIQTDIVSELAMIAHTPKES